MPPRMTTTHEEISRRAREIWEREGRPEGRDMEHWLQAETELRQEGLRHQSGANMISHDQNMMRVSAGPKEENGRKRTSRRGR